MESVNPATGETVETYDDDSDEEVNEALDRANERFETWSERPISERQQLLTNVADVLRDNQEEYAELITKEMGKPIAQSRSEVEKCAWACDYYSQRADEFLQDEVIGGEPDARTLVSYEPLGTVLSIMPWNFPFWQVFRFAAPNITAGNTGVFKHASNVPGCAVAIQEIFEEAGYPEGVFNTMLIGSEKIDDVIADDRVSAVTLTGSEGTGRQVGESAGQNLKKHLLELGGSDPFIVLDDADIEAAADTAATARTINSGQSCIAAKRFIVHDDVYDEFLDRFITEMDDLTTGDPMDDDTDLGPQARDDLLDTLHDQVEASVDQGATLELGGEPLDREGHYYPPTVLTDIPEDAPAAAEEVFGPAAAVFRASDEADAIEQANDHDLGLGASIWTEDLERGERVAREVEAGLTYVNELVKSDPRVPFGGIKDSGYGRELARFGIQAFVNKKTVWIQSPSEHEGTPAE